MRCDRRFPWWLSKETLCEVTIEPLENFPTSESRDVSEGKIVYDTSVYIEVLRSKRFAEFVRARYQTNIVVRLGADSYLARHLSDAARMVIPTKRRPL